MIATHRIPLESKSLANLGNQTWNMKKVPDRDAAGIHFIDRVEFLIILSAITQGGGGAASPLDLHNIVKGVIMNANDGNAWGPANVNGQTMTESTYFASGKPIPFAKDINGDNTVAAGVGPVTRLIRVVFDFSKFGRPGSYCPPATFFKAAGTISANLTAPANNTTLTGTVQPVIYTHGEPKLRAVQRLTLRGNKLASQDFEFPGSGMLQQAFLEKNADIVAADITDLSLSGSGGFEGLLKQTDILASRAEVYNHNPEVTAANIQRTFCDPVGGTRPRAVLVFPVYPTSEGVGQLPTSNSFTAKLNGDAAQITNYTACTVVVEPLSQPLGDAQLVSQGASRGSIASTMHDTPGGSVHNDRIKAYIPKVVGSASVVK